jgi:hypothetical protein
VKTHLLAGTGHEGDNAFNRTDLSTRMATVLFTEVFPFAQAPGQQLRAYAIPADVHGGRLAYQLRLLLPDLGWAWVRGQLVAFGHAPSSLIGDAFAEAGAALGVPLAPPQPRQHWEPDAYERALCLIRASIEPMESDLRRALAAAAAAAGQFRVERIPRFSAYVVGGEPAVAIGITSRVIAAADLASLIAQGRISPEDLTGLLVADVTSTLVGTVQGVVGVLGAHRARLLRLTRRPVMVDALRAAPDSTPVVALRGRSERTYDYIASVLVPVLGAGAGSASQRSDDAGPRAEGARTLGPAERADLVRRVADLLKVRGIVAAAYNSRTHPGLFAVQDYLPDLRFGGGRVRPFDANLAPRELEQHGMFRARAGSAGEPLRIAVIQGIGAIADDFVQAMARRLPSIHPPGLEVLRVRKVRVLSSENLLAAWRRVLETAPQVVLVLLPDRRTLDFDAVGLLGDASFPSGIAARVVFERDLHEEAAMVPILMSLLGSAGFLPYVLGAPLDGVDRIVGLAAVQAAYASGHRWHLMARSYTNDGVFLGYRIASGEGSADDAIPPAPLHAVLPPGEFAGKRVWIHYSGPMPAALLDGLGEWARSSGVALDVIDVLWRRVPRLYAFADGVAAPARGSMFHFGPGDVALITTEPGKGRTARPLRLQVRTGDITAGQAAYGLLAFTLLHYGHARQARLPVTIEGAERFAELARKGLMPPQGEGDLPFWSSGVV